MKGQLYILAPLIFNIERHFVKVTDQLICDGLEGFCQPETIYKTNYLFRKDP